MTTGMQDQFNRMVAFMGKLGQTLGNLIHEGIEAGEIDPAVDPFVAAILGDGTAAVPEPSTLFLALVALAVVAGWRKWKRAA